MKFNDFKYERPKIGLVKNELIKLVDNLNNANSLDEALSIIKKYHKYEDNFSSNVQLAYIRHSLDTNDKFYNEEKDYLNKVLPEIQEYSVLFQKALLDSKFKDELEKELGILIFTQAKLIHKTFDPKIIPELQRENELSNEYSKLLASALIEFEGKTYNLSEMRPFSSNINRDIRKKASQAVSAWFNINIDKFDRIYDDLVKVRHEMALKLGYPSYVELAYDNLMRTDYNKDDVKTYRDQVYEEIVPLVKELVKRKGERIKIKDLKSYDLTLSFLNGNPSPKGNKDWQVEKALEMYQEMSEETYQFFQYMVDKDLLNLDSKKGKEGGGYCTYIPSYEAPFIFANFNGTSGDVDVLTHEAGHAFQVYSSRHLIPEYRWPTMESAEIHSMSMEFLAWPWIDKFFKEDTNKYKFDHLSGAIEFLPYGVLVDEFQHEVYENPKLSPKERRALWRNLEKKYLPQKIYDNDKFLEEGGFFFRQSHIFTSPFYYIDYTLAQVVALEFWSLSQEDFKKAWDKYYKLCTLGGSKTFLGLLEEVNLKNPFKKGTIKEVMKPINKYLNSINDKEL
ncbi:MAG: M3 family oligoendopeptidase [Acholeplasmataceae bacterium]